MTFVKTSDTNNTNTVFGSLKRREQNRKENERKEKKRFYFLSVLGSLGKKRKRFPFLLFGI